MSLRNNLLRIFKLGLNPHEISVFQTQLNTLVDRYIVWPDRIRLSNTPYANSTQEQLILYDFIKREILLHHENLKELSKLYTEFNQRIAKAQTNKEQHQYILDFSKALGSNNRELKKDRKALSRWMDADTLLDRFDRKQGEAEVYIVFCMGRIKELAKLILNQQKVPDEYKYVWDSMEVRSWNQSFWTYGGDERVRVAAFQSLASHLRELPSSVRNEVVDQSTVQFVYRASMQISQSVWVQCEALSLLAFLSKESLRAVLRKRISKPQGGDDLFVRRRAVRIVGEQIDSMPSLAELFLLIKNDPSPFVRQGLVEALNQAPLETIEETYPYLLIDDLSPKVRAAAALGAIPLIQRVDSCHAILSTLQTSLKKEENEFVLRTLMFTIVRIAEISNHLPSNIHQKFYLMTQEELDNLHQYSSSLSVRRWASMSIERLWLISNPKYNDLYQRLRSIVRNIKPGKSKWVSSKLFKDYSNQEIGRVLSVIAQDDFACDLNTGYFLSKLTRGFVFRFRTWRMLYELRHPSPDKRQAFPHMIGRVATGTIRAPSAILAELSETKVIGEPLYIPSESGWRPYLPLVDDFLSVLQQGRNPVELYTYEGITRIQAPRNWLRRWWAYGRITCQFAELARKRNWHENSINEPDHYIQSFRRFGFQIDFISHERKPAQPVTKDPAVERFFAFGFPMVEWQTIWQQFQTYFVSVYENSLWELGLFLLALLGIFIWNHWWNHYRFQKSRRSIPLVIGGWGTRGKSGTERLKASLFNATGYNVFSKTTGCEAMFLYGNAFCRMHEIFLYRSYDKATIWEQRDMVHMASELNSQTFLWECMGLTPTYVEILQKRWMQDDLSTITNTYPDHEDIQGPAGINVAEAMTQFIPKGSTLITSEEEMKPILQHASEHFQTNFRSVGWLEAGLLTEDLLNRFPYQEHPYNIALVLGMAREMGIDGDFAIKEMPDHVIPDLGVLKIYPISEVYNRQLQFINGMSANERRGCLDNWTRMNLDHHDIEKEPGMWITTVVNNRADRIPRSRVFASILVNDISADKHYLIGGNLNGMMGYIREELDNLAQTITICASHKHESITPEETLINYARQFRLPYTWNIIEQQLRCMLNALDELPDDEIMKNSCDDPTPLCAFLDNAKPEGQAKEIKNYFCEQREAYIDFQKISEKIKIESQDSAINNQFRELLKSFFMKKFIVIDDYHATGEQIVNTIARTTPPAFVNRIMGLQNIKGTGLDFVYRWQAWDQCHEDCERALDRDPLIAIPALKSLATFQDYGLLSKEKINNLLEELENSIHIQREEFQSLVRMISSQFNSQMNIVHESIENANYNTGNTFFNYVYDFIESILDGYDAIKRKRTAKQIYRDLVHHRISLQRAAIEMKELVSRQKGGWLRKKNKR